MLVDAHAHIFPEVNGLTAEGPTKGLGYGRVSVGNKQIQVLPPLCPKTTHTVEMLISHMDHVGVEKAVLLQGPFYGECNEVVRDAVRRCPDRLIGLAYFDPWHPQPNSIFSQIVDSHEFVGIKLEFSQATGLCGFHPGSRLDDAQISWFWDELESRGMVVVIDLGAVACPSYQTSAVRTIATKHPELTIVIAHLAQPSPLVMADHEAKSLWREQIELGLLPNIYFDTASLPAYVYQESYPFPTAGRYIQEAIECVGISKVMWGTDVPALLTTATYKQLLSAAYTQLDFLDEAARSMVLGGNALNVFRRRS